MQSARRNSAQGSKQNVKLLGIRSALARARNAISYTRSMREMDVVTRQVTVQLI
jgi:hypothetical protein